ncbi:Peroxisome proliferator-activated receptor gamma coactivator 1-alpha [Portunus trituberculatus]|uniref:Peroxisome proliferator-activated receptor gamma coactivator 1-alpha n=1 Tax=Portunus trituberculatus TaxID=210409 RepID=A0A5B7EAC3_PORTR|nr:Peroxisome proliferator-activated receptor gamma coactivator 1-alpha [Portunus trituberculatus]
MVPSLAHCENQALGCRTEKEDAIPSDLVSLMEEFDRNGIENGVYGVTPSHSVSDAQDTDLEQALDVTMPNEETSDEEELVVDEAVSHSVAVGRRQQQRRQRQRNESVCSFAGPCVAPDLLLAPDSGGTASQVREEDIMTEIAGELDCSMLIEEPAVPSPVKQEKEERWQMKEVKGKRGPSTIKQEVECDLDSIDVKREPLEVSQISIQGVEDIESDKVQRQASDKEETQQPSLATERKDMKLPAGSVVLAMVDEAGSLVPLPQFKVNPQTLTDALDHTPEEDVDVETVSEKTPVLEAGDLASLLAQFEASEAVNTPDSDSPRPECAAAGVNKETGVPTDSLQTPNTEISQHKKTLQASPTHQNIKDALPKEIIEKIKASTKRKSTQMLSEPVAVRKGRGAKTKDSSSSHRTKGSRAPAQQPQPPAGPQQSQKDQRVPPPLDHDYCCSTDKTKRGNRTSSDRSFNKLPEYYTTIPTKDGDVKKSGTTSSDDGQDDVGKKDSGVESGDVSDASVEIEERKKESKEFKISQDPTNTSGERKKGDNGDKADVYNKLPAYVTDISNVKPREEEVQEEAGTEVKAEEKEPDIQKQQETKKHKRKLNLSEYRQRIKSAQNSRCPSPASSTTSTIANSPQQATEAVEGTQIPTQTMAEEQDVQDPPQEPETAPKEEMEEGELEGDSEPEILTRVNPGTINNEGSSEVIPVRPDSKIKNARGGATGDPVRHSLPGHGGGGQGHALVLGQEAVPLPHPTVTVTPAPDLDQGPAHGPALPRPETGGVTGAGVQAGRDTRPVGHGPAHLTTEVDGLGLGLGLGPDHLFGGVQDTLAHPPEDENRVKQVEERRVIYIGRISEGTTKAELRTRFEKYGTIVDISVHFREHGTQKNVVFVKTAAGLGMRTGLSGNMVSERDNSGVGEGESRALFTTMCAAIQLPDIFTTNKPLELIILFAWAAVVQWNHVWSKGSPSARVQILSTVRVEVGLSHSGQRFPSGWALR